MDPIAYYTLEPIYRPSQPIHLNVHIQFDPGMVGKGVLVCCMTSLRKIINGQITTLIDFHFDTFGFLNDHAHAFCIMIIGHDSFRSRGIEMESIKVATRTVTHVRRISSFKY